MSKTPDYVPPIPSRAFKPNISKFAEIQRERTGLKSGFDLIQLVKRNRGDIEYIGFLDDEQTDAIIVEPDNSFTIRLSSHTGALRDNFTIAHELGHLLLHWPLVRKTNPGFGMRATRWVDDTIEALKRCEWEANWFASALLMPSEDFKKAFAEGTAADTFGVTSAAVKVRAKNLGLL